MAWENDKSTAADPDNPSADEQLTADEWDKHVAEGHWLPNNAQLGQNADGDPIITDPQNGGATIMRYDRSAGSWVFPALEADTVDKSKYDAIYKLGSDQSLSDGVITRLTWDNQIKDEIGSFGADNEVWTADEDGKYEIRLSVTMSTLKGTGDSTAFIGSSLFTDRKGYNSGNSGDVCSVVRDMNVSLNAGDSIYLETRTRTGSNEAAASGLDNTTLTISKEA